MKEFTEFLGSQSPYDGLSSDDLRRIAASVEVEFFTAGSVIVEADGPVLEHLWVVRSGEVEVRDRGRVVDVLVAGDTFGHVSTFSGMAPAVSIVAGQEVLCYRLPDPRPLLSQPERLRFSGYGPLMSRERLSPGRRIDRRVAPVSSWMRPPVWVELEDDLVEVAARITAAGQSYALLRHGDEIGIITDNDVRREVAQGVDPRQRSALAVASLPARTVNATELVEAAFLGMVEHDIHHLVVTSDDGLAVGVVRVVDLAAAEVRDPLMLRTSLRRAETIEEVAAAVQLLPATLSELFEAGVPVLHLGAVQAAVIDAVVQKVIDLERGAAGSGPTADFSWLVLGSLARREPLPGSDVDTGLVWLDGASLYNPASSMLTFAERVLSALERCGLKRCPDGANATNPLFARSRSTWVSAATGWIREPAKDRALLLTSMLVDARPVAGLALGRSVTEAMLAEPRSREFLTALLRFTLSRRTPTGFVRDFVVEHSGQHRGRLDLKAGGLVPIASLGRWVAVLTGDDRGSTSQRIRRGQDAGLFTTDESDTLVGAFEEIYTLLMEREVHALANGATAGTWIDPKTLDSLERRHLRESFRAVSEVQNRLSSEWVTRLP